MKLSQSAYEIGKQTSKTFQQFLFFWSVTLWILGCFAISVQIFLRKGFGERYASVFNLIVGCMAMGFFCGVTGFAMSAASHESLSGVMELLYTCGIGLAVFHRFSIWSKNRKSVVWHSMYSGTPWLCCLGVNDRVTKRWIEPLVLFTLGYFARSTGHTPVATWLYVGAVAIFVHETLQDYMQRNDLLDARDAMIEANYKAGIVTGRQPQNQGFAMSQASMIMLKQNMKTDELSDDTLRILDTEVEQ